VFASCQNKKALRTNVHSAFAEYGDIIRLEQKLVNRFLRESMVWKMYTLFVFERMIDSIIGKGYSYYRTKAFINWKAAWSVVPGWTPFS